VACHTKPCAKYCGLPHEALCEVLWPATRSLVRSIVACHTKPCAKCGRSVSSSIYNNKNLYGAKRIPSGKALRGNRNDFATLHLRNLLPKMSLCKCVPRASFHVLFKLYCSIFGAECKIIYQFPRFIFCRMNRITRIMVI